MSRSITIRAYIPETADVAYAKNHERTVRKELEKHPAITGVNIRTFREGAARCDCHYDEKKHPNIDTTKLGKELEAIVAKLGYKIAKSF